MRYSEFIGLRVEPELREALQAIARAQQRSVAQVIRMALQDFIKRYLEAKAPAS